MAKWIGFAITALVVIVALLMYLGGNNDTLSVQVDAPQTVPVNDPFEVTLNLTNPSSEDQTIVSIGLEQDLLDKGLRVEGLVPAYRETTVRGAWREHVFSITRRPVMPPASDFPLTLTLIATQPGIYEGTITIWLENGLRAIYVELEFEAEQSS